MPTPDPADSGPLIPTNALSFVVDIENPGDADSPVTASVKRDMPYDGVIRQIYVNVPDGVHSRVGFKVVDDERGVEHYPFDEETEFASFNDVDRFFPTTFPMRRKDTIAVEFINEDDTNDSVDGHHLKVWAIVTGIGALPYTLEEVGELTGVRI